MRLVTDTETLKAHITAELHAAEWATPVERKQVDKVADLIIARLQRPEKTSDITGFPEDDDIEDMEIERQVEEFYSSPLEGEEVITIRRRIPRMPRTT